VKHFTVIIRAIADAPCNRRAKFSESNERKRSKIMGTITGLKDGLRDEDLAWLFQAGVEKVVSPGTAIVHEGVRPNAIFVVIHGKFSVRVENVTNEPLAELGAGELIGEISFLEGSPASATIVAEEESAILVIDDQLLNERIRDNASFAARMYRSFALTAERRLRNRVDHLASLFAIDGGPRWQDEFCLPALS
jgi:CRP-like cAMP-binding protein